MDSRQIAIVKESFELVQPYASRLTRVFYDQLFELNPALRRSFKKDMREQRRRFIKALSFIVDNLHDADLTGSRIKELAKSHILYGVTKEDYLTFGQALIFALSAAMGDAFTPAVKSAWKSSYGTISKIMINEAYR